MKKLLLLIGALMCFGSFTFAKDFSSYTKDELVNLGYKAKKTSSTETINSLETKYEPVDPADFMGGPGCEVQPNVLTSIISNLKNKDYSSIANTSQGGCLFMGGIDYYSKAVNGGLFLVYGSPQSPSLYIAFIQYSGKVYTKNAVLFEDNSYYDWYTKAGTDAEIKKTIASKFSSMTDSDIAKMFTDRDTRLDAIESDSEFKDALEWMHQNGLTSFNTVDDYKPLDNVSREQAAKFYSQFDTNVLKKTDVVNNECSFSDLSSLDNSLQDFVKQACGLGIFKGKNGLFNGKSNLTRAEAITALIRMGIGTLDESGDIWYKNYYDKAHSIELIKKADYSDGGNNISRYEMALLLYRAHFVNFDQYSADASDIVDITNQVSVESGTANSDDECQITFNTKDYGTGYTNTGLVIDCSYLGMELGGNPVQKAVVNKKSNKIIITYYDGGIMQTPRSTTDISFDIQAKYRVQKKENKDETKVGMKIGGDSSNNGKIYAIAGLGIVGVGLGTYLYKKK